jgi:hypothetical protein
MHLTVEENESALGLIDAPRVEEFHTTYLKILESSLNFAVACFTLGDGYYWVENWDACQKRI